MVRTLKGHGHWVNTLALSSEYALRTGPHDHHGRAPADPAAAKQAGTPPPDAIPSLAHSCDGR